MKASLLSFERDSEGRITIIIVKNTESRQHLSICFSSFGEFTIRPTSKNPITISATSLSIPRITLDNSFSPLNVTLETPENGALLVKRMSDTNSPIRIFAHGSTNATIQCSIDELTIDGNYISIQFEDPKENPINYPIRIIPRTEEQDITFFVDDKDLVSVLKNIVFTEEDENDYKKLNITLETENPTYTISGAMLSEKTSDYPTILKSLIDVLEPSSEKPRGIESLPIKITKKIKTTNRVDQAKYARIILERIRKSRKKTATK